jgi:hypothetical protein
MFINFVENFDNFDNFYNFYNFFNKNKIKGSVKKDKGEKN